MLSSVQARICTGKRLCWTASDMAIADPDVLGSGCCQIPLIQGKWDLLPVSSPAQLLFKPISSSRPLWWEGTASCLKTSCHSLVTLICTLVLKWLLWFMVWLSLNLILLSLYVILDSVLWNGSAKKHRSIKYCLSDLSTEKKCKCVTVCCTD